MSKPQFPPPVKLFFTCLYPLNLSPRKILEILINQFGPIHFFLGPIPFSFSDYYQKEMGTNLLKIYFSFKNKIEREEIIEIKHFSFALEKLFSQHGKRTFNLDPGFISRENLVLTTGKNFSHRIYLGKGIFAETTLIFRKKEVEEFSWTFPDFKTDLIKNFIQKIRKTLLLELKNEKK